MRTEESIRSHAMAGAVDAAQAEATRRDALHATCRATAARLEADLERVTGKQRTRRGRGARRRLFVACGQRCRVESGLERWDRQGWRNPKPLTPNP